MHTVCCCLCACMRKSVPNLLLCVHTYVCMCVYISANVFRWFDPQLWSSSVNDSTYVWVEGLIQEQLAYVKNPIVNSKNRLRATHVAII